MDASRALRLSFRLEDSYSNDLGQSASAVEVRDFLNIAHDTTSAIVLDEAQRLVDLLDVEPAQRLAIKTKLAAQTDTLSRASQVSSVREGSLLLDFLIDGERLAEAALVAALWTGRKVADLAWERSPLHGQIDAFLTSVFGRSREVAERAISSSRQRRGHNVEAVEVVEHRGSEAILEVRVIRLPLRNAGDWEQARELLRQMRLEDREDS